MTPPSPKTATPPQRSWGGNERAPMCECPAPASPPLRALPRTAMLRLATSAVWLFFPPDPDRWIDRRGDRSLCATVTPAAIVRRVPAVRTGHVGAASEHANHCKRGERASYPFRYWFCHLLLVLGGFGGRPANHHDNMIVDKGAARLRRLPAASARTSTSAWATGA